MKKIVIVLLSALLGCAAGYAQNKDCCKECGDCSGKCIEKIVKICNLDTAGAEQVTTLTQSKMQQMQQLYAAGEPSRKAVKSVKKNYEKSLKKIVGSRNYRHYQGCMKVEKKALALAEKKNKKK